LFLDDSFEKINPVRESFSRWTADVRIVLLHDVRTYLTDVLVAASCLERERNTAVHARTRYRSWNDVYSLIGGTTWHLSSIIDHIKQTTGRVPVTVGKRLTEDLSFRRRRSRSVRRPVFFILWVGRGGIVIVPVFTGYLAPAPRRDRRG